MARLQGKIRVQEVEAEELADRAAGVPTMTRGAYLAYLLRLRTLLPLRTAMPSAPKRLQPAPSEVPVEQPESQANDGVEQQKEASEGAWWETQIERTVG